MLSSAGFKADFIVNLLDKNFYVNHMKAKNYLIDTFFESMEAPNYYTAEMHPKDILLWFFRVQVFVSLKNVLKNLVRN